MTLLNIDTDFDKLFSNINKPDRSFAARYGNEVLQFGIAGIPNLLILNLKKLKLNHAEFHFLCIIFSRRHNTDAPFFSLNKLSKVYGFSQDTLHRAKNKLIKKGYLVIYEKRENGQGNGRNYYDIRGLLSALQKIAENTKTEY